MEKNYLAFDWPFNLLMDAFPNEKVDLENFSPPDDFMASLDYVLTTTFTDRERRILFMRYKEKMTYSAIASSPDISVGRQRVNQIIETCHRKLRQQSRRPFILLGIKGAMAQLRQTTRQIAFSDGYTVGFSDAAKKNITPGETADTETPSQQEDILDALDLSVRACNVLYRLGCTTVNQLKQLSIEELQKTRNCGVLTTNEIVTALKNYGIEIPEKGNRKLSENTIPPAKPGLQIDPPPGSRANRVFSSPSGLSYNTPSSQSYRPPVSPLIPAYIKGPPTPAPTTGFQTKESPYPLQVAAFTDESISFFEHSIMNGYPCYLHMDRAFYDDLESTKYPKILQLAYSQGYDVHIYSLNDLSQSCQMLSYELLMTMRQKKTLLITTFDIIAFASQNLLCNTLTVARFTQDRILRYWASKNENLNMPDQTTALIRLSELCCNALHIPERDTLTVRLLTPPKTT